MKLKRFTTHLVAAGLVALPWMAHAAGLGKLSVSSALGQPLVAEIEVFAADKAEFDSLTVSLASDQAFREARVEFAPILSSLQFAVERKPDGRAVLVLSTSRPVNDPFLDFVIELNWNSGRLVREYTMLLDPPGMAAPQTIAPVTVAPARTPAPVPAPAPAPASAPAAMPTAAEAPAASPAKPTDAEAAAAAPSRILVKRGDTLARIADRLRPDGVSLEQALVGLYRENTQAFVGNMNRLKAGKTLNIPDADVFAGITRQEAAREVRLQAEDWRAYRQKLAAAVQEAPAAQAEPAQAAAGRITPKVEDKAKPASEGQQDVLTLSPAAGAAADEARAAEDRQRAQEEDAIARQKALDESTQRVASLEKQIEDMQKLVDLKDQDAQAEPRAAGEAEAEPAATPEPKPAPAPVVAAPPAAPESDGPWYAPLLENPLYWGGGAAALVLGGVLWWMLAGGRRRSAGAVLEDSIMSSGEVQTNTVLGAASGGSVNTGDTSFLTDFSQAGLGTIDTHDVDPIAEAEVYMAYGRDVQAEEILKEAISKNPDRHEIRVKLLEIYAARRNAQAFEPVAGELYAALGSKPNPLWDKACEMGRSIDPTNPLYGGEASADIEPPVATVAATPAISGGALAFGADVETAAAPALEPSSEALAEAVSLPAFEAQPEPEPAFAQEVDSGLLEFESVGGTADFGSPAETSASPDEGHADADTQGLAFELPELDLPGLHDDELKLDLGLEEDDGPDSKFDFSGLDLDLGETTGSELELDEVGTKLDLARAYVEMGDKEGAREILTEVLAEGSDVQKSDAKDMLSALG